MNKAYPDAESALDGIFKDGMTLMSGGFGLCGIPETLIGALRELVVKNLTVISNNAGSMCGPGPLLETRQSRNDLVVCRRNKLFEQRYLSGELELNSILRARFRAYPRRRRRIPAFFTKTGVGS